ncbi:MAG: DUF2726 domain-containing protein [Opitutaceae bacterium]|nr:DUF2726 domain-containing protein [Opitutaceae bacterium]
MIAAKRRNDSLARVCYPPYIFRRDFIPPAQRAFFTALRTAVGDRLVICPRPDLSDVIAPRASLPPSARREALGRLARRRAGFLLLTKQDYVPVAVVEMDGGGSWGPARAERDSLVREALRGAGLAVFCLHGAAAADAAAIRAILAPVLDAPPPAFHVAGTPPPFATLSTPPFFAAGASTPAPVHRARTLMELQEERNRSRPPVPPG